MQNVFLTPSRARRAAVLLGVLAVAPVVWCSLIGPTAVAHQLGGDFRTGHVISGHVVDPHQLEPEDAILMLGRHHDGGFASIPVAVRADGSFTTPRLSPGTYVLEVVRTPHSPTKPATVVGFSIVHVGITDVSGVTGAVRRDTALTGRFRMESDNPTAEWPPFIAVSAFVALDGLPLLPSTGAEGAPSGTFVLRNAFGPRVLRCGYSLAEGGPWWPSQVMLDGVDITNVPTDFSEHEQGQLEIVFTQHPTRIVGTVTDDRGQPVRAPWVSAMSADRTLWQPWATTSEVTQGDAMGRFALTMPPGQYLLAAVPQTAFDSLAGARPHILRLAADGVAVAVGERETSTVRLTAQDR